MQTKHFNGTQNNAGSYIPCNVHPHLFTWIRDLVFVIYLLSDAL